jgi:hypothetical protein
MSSAALENSKQSIDAHAPQTANETRMNRIAQRAYEIYEARGGEHGKSLEDWLQAEREIDAEIDREETRGKVD